MLELLREIFAPKIPEEKIDSIMGQLKERYPEGSDPWGLDLKRAKRSLNILWPLYNDYFKVRVFGKEHVENKPYVVVANHSGQIAVDAMLICMAFILEIDPPKMLRPMVERFVTKLPFFGQWMAEGGGVLGDRENCIQLLKRMESVLVFPEGVKGVAKSSQDYYKLQKFTKGFFRQAIQSNTDVLPIAVIVAEEFYPFVYQSKSLAKLLGLPAFPITPTMILGPLGLLPLPSPVDIIIGAPYKIPEGLTNESSEEVLQPHIDKVVEQIEEMINDGRKKRREFWANKEMDGK